MVTLYIDEDFSYPVVRRLRQLGHDMLTAHEAGQAVRRGGAIRARFGRPRRPARAEEAPQVAAQRRRAHGVSRALRARLVNTAGRATAIVESQWRAAERVSFHAIQTQLAVFFERIGRDD